LLNLVTLYASMQRWPKEVTCSAYR